MPVSDFVLRLVAVADISLSDCVYFLKKFYGLTDYDAILLVSDACGQTGVSFLEEITF